MNVSNRQRAWTVIGAAAGVVIVLLGILFLVDGDRPQTTPGAAPTVSSTTPSPTVTLPSVSGPSLTNPTTPATSSPTAKVMTVKIYFNDDPDDPTHVLPVERTVPWSPQVATAAVGQLLAGPTAAERNAGYYSWFSSATAGMLRSVRVTNGVAYVDFQDFSRIIPNASTSHGSAELMAELDSTLKQYPTVESTVYSFNGDVDAFYLWLQLTPPTGTRG
jgi:spore germination protein GerM